MLAAKLCRIPVTTFVSTLSKPSNTVAVRSPCQVCRTQGLGTQARTSSLRGKVKRLTLKERAMAPAGDGGMLLMLDLISPL
jgi:hypothetical protein